jgi:hypothetical protein
MCPRCSCGGPSETAACSIHNCAFLRWNPRASRLAGTLPCWQCVSKREHTVPCKRAEHELCAWTKVPSIAKQSCNTHDLCSDTFISSDRFLAAHEEMSRTHAPCMLTMYGTCGYVNGNRWTEHLLITQDISTSMQTARTPPILSKRISRSYAGYLAWKRTYCMSSSQAR